MEKDGERERGETEDKRRVEAFKRLLVTKLMASFIRCFCRLFTRSLYTLCRFILASGLNGKGGRTERGQGKVHILVPIKAQVYFNSC